MVRISPVVYSVPLHFTQEKDLVSVGSSITAPIFPVMQTNRILRVTPEAAGIDADY